MELEGVSNKGVREIRIYNASSNIQVSNTVQLTLIEGQQMSSVSSREARRELELENVE